MSKSARRPAPPPRSAWWRILWRSRRRLATTARRVVTWGIPGGLVIAGLVLAMLSRAPAGQAILSGLAEQGLRLSAAFGLVVDDILVEGRETTDVQTIMAALAARRGTPILAVNPNRAKQQLETLPWVRSAAIERRLPSTLYVRLVERHPLAVWQHNGKQELIDRDGEVIPVTDLSRFARLPSVVGAAAPKHAAALLAMLAREPELAARVTAAVRVDDRRWNVRIDNMIDVLLPEEDPGDAWARLAALERENSVLKRDLQSIDMRLPDRFVLRTAAPPPKETGPGKPRLAGKSL